MTDLAVHRAFYADLIAAKAGGCDPRVVAAFGAVPRERFLGPGPWRVYTRSGYIPTPCSDPALLYQDILVALDEDGGINNGQPSLHALCLNEVLPCPGDRIVHVGAGTGYYTAVLAELVGPTGQIQAFEIDPQLAARCAVNVEDRSNIAVLSRSAMQSPIPLADVIYVCAGVPYPPAVWLDAIRLGGRLIFPLTPGKGRGGMLKVTRTGQDSFAAKFVCDAMFIPCVAGPDEGASAALSSVFDIGGSTEVRSLRRTPHVPDETCWLAGEDWWLSTRPA